METGHAVQFFHAADPVDLKAQYLCPLRSSGGPRLQQSHGWLDGVLQAPFSPAAVDPARRDTWPIVLPRQDLLFADRSGTKPPTPLGQLKVPPAQLREPCTRPPALSLVLVRWGGEHNIGAGSEGDGGWGRFGCPPSDEYMSALVDMGVLRHPKLGGEEDSGSRGREGRQGAAVRNGKDRRARNFEIFSLFVRHARDVREVAAVAPWLAATLQGRRKVAFWMVWPAEWEESGSSDYAGYIDRSVLFATMRACEDAGIRSGFPHPADLYQLITSKSWMAGLCLNPQAHLPAAVLVTKGSVVSNPKRAAKQALAALAFIRSQNPFPVGPAEPPAPSVVNKDGVKKGMVKLGWSWEARYVSSFMGEEQLAAKLLEMTTYAGCTATTCIVQEWVDFDFEMRLYFLPPDEWSPTDRMLPVKLECNKWTGAGEEGRPANFRKLSEAMCVTTWDGDAEAFRLAKEQAVDVSQHLLGYLLAMDSQPVPMIRLDFMMRRFAPGKVRVVFGEYCEMGACCLAWEDGPPTIWRAALDSVLR